MIKFGQIDEYKICFNCSEVPDEQREQLLSHADVIILEGKNTNGIPLEVGNPLGMQWNGKRWNAVGEEDWSDVSRMNEVSFEEMCMEKMDTILKEIEELKSKL